MTQSEKIITKYPELSKSPIFLEIPVLWGDMDSAKHVNNLIYLKWSETARIKLFEKLMDTSFQGKQGPILGWQDCKYIFPMTYPDYAIVTCAVTEIGTDRFIMESRIYSVKHERIAALTRQSIIPYDYIALKKIELPELWIDRLEQLKVNDEAEE